LPRQPMQQTPNRVIGKGEVMDRHAVEGDRSSPQFQDVVVLFLLISASFYKPYGPATSFNAGVIPPLADSLRTAM
jgi:hypothetical protein